MGTHPFPSKKKKTLENKKLLFLVKTGETHQNKHYFERIINGYHRLIFVTSNFEEKNFVYLNQNNVRH
jgi:hypothetical protein